MLQTQLLRENERDGDDPTECCQVVLHRTGTVEKDSFHKFGQHKQHSKNADVLHSLSSSLSEFIQG